MATTLIEQIISRPSPSSAEFNLGSLIGERASITVEIGSINKMLHMEYDDARCDLSLDQREKDLLRKEAFRLDIGAHRDVITVGDRRLEEKYAGLSPLSKISPVFRMELDLVIKGIKIAYDTPQFFTAKIGGLYFQFSKRYERSFSQPFFMLHDEKGATILALALHANGLLYVYYDMDRMADVTITTF